MVALTRSIEDYVTPTQRATALAAMTPTPAPAPAPTPATTSSFDPIAWAYANPNDVQYYLSQLGYTGVDPNQPYWMSDSYGPDYQPSLDPWKLDPTGYDTQGNAVGKQVLTPAAQAFLQSHAADVQNAQAVGQLDYGGPAGWSQGYSYGALEQALKKAGYTGPVTKTTPGGWMEGEGGGFETMGIALTPQAAQFLKDHGLTVGSQNIGGNTIVTGLFDKNNNLAYKGQESYSNSGGFGDFLKNAALAVGLTSGISELLGGAGLLGSLGGAASAAAPAVGNGAFLGEGIASGIPAWDAAATNAGLALTGATAAAPAVGNGAFLGEGTSAGVPQWDAAMSNAAPAIPPSTPSVFNAAQDSQLANQQLGITGDQAAAAATIPNTVDLTNAGGTMSTGIGSYPVTAPSTGITPAQLQQGINAAKQLTGGNTPTAPTQANNSGLASLLGALGGLGGLGQQPGYAETAVNMGAINPFNIHGMDLATTPTTGIQAMPGQGQSPDLNTSAGLLRLLGITQ